jgi:hypothetical protein
MTCSWEYHIVVRRRIPASVALFILLAPPSVFVANGFGQASAQAASGGHSFASAPISPISPGSQGASVNSSPSASSQQPRNPYGGFLGHHGRGYVGEIYYAPPIPYAIPTSAAENDAQAQDEDNDADYQGGPTIFDRRGSGADSYVPPVRKVPTPHAGVGNAALSVPDVPLEPTLLIFKDGHKLEVENYAVVGPRLVDLTPGHQRTVALADLDLGATRRQNDDRGIVFHVPQQIPGRTDTPN